MRRYRQNAAYGTAGQCTGNGRLPAYERYRRRMEYEKAEPDVEEMTEIEADPGTLVEQRLRRWKTSRFRSGDGGFTTD